MLLNIWMRVQLNVNLTGNNSLYYTLNSLTLFWLAESVQWIFEISAPDVITADYTIIMSRTLEVTGNHVKFARLVLFAVSEEAKTWLLFIFRSMWNKTIIRFGVCDVQNNQVRRKSYQPQPSPLRLITLTSALIILGITKTSSNNCSEFCTSRQTSETWKDFKKFQA